jgi:alginate O-acetyltransferase complex protein AlgI
MGFAGKGARGGFGRRGCATRDASDERTGSRGPLGRQRVASADRMVFSSPLFLFGFLPLFLLLYRLMPARFANATALAASLVFYGWGEPVFVLFALGSALLDLAIVRRMAASTDPRTRRALVAAGCVANLGLLAWFKYANFAVASVRPLVESWAGVALPQMAAIALPIGVSFIVFEKITYIVDVYRGTSRPARSIGDYLTYVFLFPKLLAGPIIKYHDIAGQLTDRPKRLDDLAAGLCRFATGLAMKVLIADPMGELADIAFAPGPPIGFGLAWVGAVAYALQIFFDFAGYSSMAIGIARTMGFRLMENFDRPYLAVGFGDFWKRWHISLSSWVRDYLYIPLGGSRVSAPRLYLNLWICFLASGLWHGAAWTFVVWGAYHGLFITLDRLFLKRLLDRLPRAVAIGFTFLAVTVGWVLFRSPDFASALGYLRAMADPGAVSERFVYIAGDLYPTMALGLAICFLPAVPSFERLRRAFAQGPRWPTLAMATGCGLLLLALGKATTVAFHPFLYFRF